jgi:hypothetical protein
LFESFFPSYEILSRTFLRGGGEDIGTLFDGNPSCDSLGKSYNNASIDNLFDCPFESRSNFDVFDSEKRLIEDMLLKR